MPTNEVSWLVELVVKPAQLEHIIAEMQTRREQLGFSYYVVSDRVMQDVAPIVGRLAGA